jgi:hypothetical protein
MGLAVRTGRIGANTGRIMLVPVPVVGRSPIAAPFRGRVEGLAETGRSAGIDARRRLETVAGDVLATPEAEQVVDGVLAGALPEAVARSLLEHRVVERVVVEALASADTCWPGRYAAFSNLRDIPAQLEFGLMPRASRHSLANSTIPRCRPSRPSAVACTQLLIEATVSPLFQRGAAGRRRRCAGTADPRGF